MSTTAQETGGKPSIGDRLREGVRRRRGQWAWFDHLVRANDRNTEVYGSRLAGGITYFAFLSFFPLLAVSFAALGFIVEFYPDAQTSVETWLGENLPGIVGTDEGQIDVGQIADARAGAGIIGALGLLYSGLGAVAAAREALRQVFGLPRYAANIVVAKLADLSIVVLLGSAILVTFGLSTVTTNLTASMLALVDLDDSIVATVLFRLLAVAVAVALNTVIFALLLGLLGGKDTDGKRSPWRRIRTAALIGGVGFEILKLAVTLLIGNTLQNPLYGAFAVVVALLVWMNFAARLLVFCAAWAATEPYSVNPGEGPGSGAGRTTPLAAGTEPVLAVLPPPPPGTDVADGPVPSDGHLPSEGGGITEADFYADRRRSVALGALVGGAAAGMVARRRGRRSRS